MRLETIAAITYLKTVLLGLRLSMVDSDLVNAVQFLQTKVFLLFSFFVHVQSHFKFLKKRCVVLTLSVVVLI